MRSTSLNFFVVAFMVQCLLAQVHASTTAAFAVPTTSMGSNAASGVAAAPTMASTDQYGTAQGIPSLTTTMSSSSNEDSDGSDDNANASDAQAVPTSTFMAPSLTASTTALVSATATVNTTSARSSTSTPSTAKPTSSGVASKSSNGAINIKQGSGSLVVVAAIALLSSYAIL